MHQLCRERLLHRGQRRNDAEAPGRRRRGRRNTRRGRASVECGHGTRHRQADHENSDHARIVAGAADGRIGASPQPVCVKARVSCADLPRSRRRQRRRSSRRSRSRGAPAASRSMPGSWWPGASMKKVGCARTCSYVRVGDAEALGALLARALADDLEGGLVLDPRSIARVSSRSFTSRNQTSFCAFRASALIAEDITAQGSAEPRFRAYCPRR